RPTLIIHTFPTRRSSDLQEYVTNYRLYKHPSFGDGYEAIHGVVGIWVRVIQGTLSEVGPPSDYSRTDLGSGIIFRRTVRRVNSKDRKSTRLNSSHEWISY